MVKTEGKLSISKIFSNREETYMSITIKDNRSRRLIVEAKVSLLEFMEALTGLAERPIELELHNVCEPIGLYREIKQADPIILDNRVFDKNSEYYVFFWPAIKGSISKDRNEGWELAPHQQDLQDNYKRRKRIDNESSSVSPLLERFVKDKPANWDEI